LKTLQEILTDTAGHLQKHGSDSARSDAEWLACHALKLGKLDLYMQFDRPLTDAELDVLRPLVKRRAAGEPVQYIVGEMTFHSVDLVVGPEVLIPRPETERLVDEAVTRYTEGEILDICTGSGAILFAISAVLESPPAMTGVDISAAALVWAQRNRELLQAEHIQFTEGDLLAPVRDRQFSMITANPPYISAAELPGLASNVRDFEPHTALVAEDDGLAIIRRIAESAQGRLLPGGDLLCEIGAGQGESAASMFEQAGWEAVEVLRDYNDLDRIVAAKKLT
jgi:release factor glutamine methyltransferase